jgi:hypothetical protein
VLGAGILRYIETVPLFRVSKCGTPSMVIYLLGTIYLNLEFPFLLYYVVKKLFRKPFRTPGLPLAGRNA